jgi:uncharacterized protein involved in outer membrane biogenesis
MMTTPKKHKLSRPLKVGVWCAALAAGYTLAGFLVLPAIIKAEMLKRLPPLIHRRAAIRQVAFNPYTLALAVRGLALTETNGDSFAGCEEIHVQFQAVSSLLNHAWVFKDFTLTGPFLQITRFQNGQFNFDNLSQSNAASGGSAPLPALLVESLRVNTAAVTVDDLATAPGFHHKVAPIYLRLTNFTTKSNSATSYTVSAATDWGENCDAAGTLTVQPLHFSGGVKISGLDLKSYAPYLTGFTVAEVLDGKLAADAEYQVTPAFDITVTNANARLTGLRVKAPETAEPVVSIPSFSVELADARFPERRLRVRSVTSTGGSLTAHRDHDGTISLLSLIKQSPPTDTAAPPWAAQVDDIAFDNYAMQIEDRTPAHPVKLALQDVAFKIHGFSTASNASLTASASMRLNRNATLSINGTISLLPVTANVNVDLAGLDLPPFQPYLADQIKLALTAGRLDVHGRARYMDGLGNPLASFSGDLGLTNLATVDAAHYRDLVKIEGLAVSGIAFNLQPDKLEIKEIKLAGLQATLMLDTKGQPNILSVLPPKRAAASTPGPPEVFPVSLGALVIDNASLHFIDESIQPNCVFDVQEIGGTIKGVSSTEQGPAAVDLQGKVDQYSTFSVIGSADPLSSNLTLNLSVSFRNLELTSFTPYMERYGGYPLNKGKLLMDLQYDIHNRKLIATNKVTIAGLILGAKTSSPEATHLPVKLGIALLKDRSGKIVLDIPVSGSLDDPNFRVIPIVWQVVRNLLAKAATSPFSLLGAVLGGSGGEELSSVQFSPGSSAIDPAEEGKIQKLIQALHERPALSLQITGDAARSLDGPAIARAHFERRVKAQRARELAKAGKTTHSVESIKINSEDYSRLVQEMYQRTFATNPATPVAASAPAPILGSAREESDSTPWTTREFVKGGEVLQRHDAYEERHAKPEPLPPPPIQAPDIPPVASDIAIMQQRLIGEIPVTDDELRELMQARAHAVQSALMESGKVPPDHIFVLAPAPSVQGRPRVNFSLE